MNDPPDVLLVDTHAKCDGGHNTGQFPLQKFVLDAFPLCGRHAGMIGPRPDAVFAEKGRHCFRGLLKGNIDNGRRLRRFQDSLQQAGLFFRCGCGRNLEKKVVPVKTGDTDILFRQIELGAHVVHDPRCRRGRQQEGLLDAEFLLVGGQVEIFGPEIVPPFGNAVRFVDHQ